MSPVQVYQQPPYNPPILIEHSLFGEYLDAMEQKVEHDDLEREEHVR